MANERLEKSSERKQTENNTDSVEKNLEQYMIGAFLISSTQIEKTGSLVKFLLYIKKLYFRN